MKVFEKIKSMTKEEMAEFFVLLDKEYIEEFYCQNNCPYAIGNNCKVDSENKCEGNDKKIYEDFLDKEYEAVRQKMLMLNGDLLKDDETFVAEELCEKENKIDYNKFFKNCNINKSSLTETLRIIKSMQYNAEFLKCDNVEELKKTNVMLEELLAKMN